MGEMWNSLVGELESYKLKVQGLEQYVRQLNMIIDKQSEVIKAYERLHEERKQAS